MKPKKKRSPAQLRNDKRLGIMARKRAKLARIAKKKTKKKTKRKTRRNVGTLRKRQSRIQGAAQGRGRRKNPKRSAKSHLWVIFKCRGKTVHYLGLTSGALTGWKRSKAEAALFKSKGTATSGARIAAKKRGMSKWHVGAAPDSMTSAQIAAQCKKGKG